MGKFTVVWTTFINILGKFMEKLRDVMLWVGNIV